MKATAARTGIVWTWLATDRSTSALHIIHVTQARMHDPAKSYLARRKSEGKSPREARRSHKRQLANVLIRHMWKNADRLKQLPITETTATA